MEGTPGFLASAWEVLSPGKETREGQAGSQRRHWSGAYLVCLQMPFGPGGEEERLEPRAGLS